MTQALPSQIDRADEILGGLARRNVPLFRYTTYRLGGPASLFVIAETEDDLLRVREAVIETEIPTLILGRGSNLLIADRGFAGLVLTLGGDFTEVTTEGTLVRAGAAVSLPILSRKSVALGLTGMEWAVGVPGSVGGAVRMNAGGHGSQTGERLVRYRYLSLTTAEGGTYGTDKLGLSYRHSQLLPDDIVLWGEFQLEKGDRVTSERMLAEIVQWRREHQPGGRNAGSAFVNPPGTSSGKLIEESGLKGFRVKSAEVSPKHANFIQSEPGGSSADVVKLMGEVRRRVAEHTGVTLEPEVRMVGFLPEEIAELYS